MITGEYIYEDAILHVVIDDDLKTYKIKVKRGALQETFTSPKFFTFVLEDIFKNLS